MAFRDKVEKIVLEMKAGKLDTIVKTVKDRALAQILKEVPEQIEKLFIKRMKEVDGLIEQRVKEHVKNEMDKGNN